MIHSTYNTLKRALLLLVLAAGAMTASAQDDILLGQQWLSRLNRNPAAAGVSTNPLDLTMFYRNQWNIDDALTSMVFNIDGSIPSWKSGLGLTITYDQPSPANKDINALFSYAYRFHISEKFKLSLGLAAGIMNRAYDPSKFIVDGGYDPGMIMDKTTSSKADFSVGTELTSDRLTVGVGLTHVGNTDAGTTDDSRSLQQVYSYARYYIPVATSFEIAPSASWLHYNDGNLFEVGATGLFDKKYWIGAAWRPNSSAVFMAGLEVYLFRLGYAYDLSIGDANSVGTGTHEIMLQVALGKKK